MDVRHGQHHMAVVIDLGKREIVPLDLTGRSLQCSPETRENPVGRHFVSRRNRDEYAAAALVGRQPVTSLGVGQRNGNAVRYGNALQRFVARINNTLYRSAGAVGQCYGSPILGCRRHQRQNSRKKEKCLSSDVSHHSSLDLRLKKSGNRDHGFRTKLSIIFYSCNSRRHLPPHTAIPEKIRVRRSLSPSGRSFSASAQANASRHIRLL